MGGVQEVQNIDYVKFEWTHREFEAINAMKLFRGHAAASRLVPEVQDDMNIEIVIWINRVSQNCLKIPSLLHPFVSILPIFLEVL